MAGAYCAKPDETPQSVPLADVLQIVTAYEKLITMMDQQGMAYCHQESDAVSALLIKYNISV